MELKLKNRSVEVGELEGDAGEGAWALDACWSDTGEALTDAELEALNDACAEALYDAWYQHQIGRAEDAWDAARGH